MNLTDTKFRLERGIGAPRAVLHAHGIDGENPNPQHLGFVIDHTLLKPTADQTQIEALAREALKHSFSSVCVHAFWVPTVYQILKGSSVVVCAVVGFPLGAMGGISQAFEASKAVESGATEIDMVINLGAIKSNLWNVVETEIKCVTRSVENQALVKVIIETCYLVGDELERSCHVAMQSGAHFVKTSTGFGAGGATVADVRRMRSTVGNHMGVKASGGIKDAATMLAMIDAGATRIGTSSGISLVQ